MAEEEKSSTTVDQQDDEVEHLETIKPMQVQLDIHGFIAANKAPRQGRAAPRKIRTLPETKGAIPPHTKRTKTKKYNEPQKVKKIVNEFDKDREVIRKDITYKLSPEPFVESFGMLYCNCCNETLGLHHSTNVRHCLSTKHLGNKKKYLDSKVQDQATLSSLESYKVKKKCWHDKLFRKGKNASLGCVEVFSLFWGPFGKH